MDLIEGARNIHKDKENVIDELKIHGSYFLAAVVMATYILSTYIRLN